MTADKARKKVARRASEATGRNYTVAERSIEKRPIGLFDLGPRCEPGCCISEQNLHPDVDYRRDSAMSYCGKCGNPVCIICGAAPVPKHVVPICKPCNEDPEGEHWNFERLGRP